MNLQPGKWECAQATLKTDSLWHRATICNRGYQPKPRIYIPFGTGQVFRSYLFLSVSVLYRLHPDRSPRLCPCFRIIVMLTVTSLTSQMYGKFIPVGSSRHTGRTTTMPQVFRWDDGFYDIYYITLLRVSASILDIV